MKQSLTQQFELSNESQYNDAYVNFLYSTQSDKLVAAYQQRKEVNAN
jgi:ABC-type sulfate transport system substrate-binding protein